MVVHSNTKLANLRETSVSFFVYCLFCCRTFLGALSGAPAAKAPPPESSEELFAVVCRTSIFNLPIDNSYRIVLRNIFIKTLRKKYHLFGIVIPKVYRCRHFIYFIVYHKNTKFL